MCLFRLDLDLCFDLPFKNSKLNDFVFQARGASLVPRLDLPWPVRLLRRRHQPLQGDGDQAPCPPPLPPGYAGAEQAGGCGALQETSPFLSLTG